MIINVLELTNVKNYIKSNINNYTYTNTGATFSATTTGTTGAYSSNHYITLGNMTYYPQTNNRTFESYEINRQATYGEPYEYWDFNIDASLTSSGINSNRTIEYSVGLVINYNDRIVQQYPMYNISELLNGISLQVTFNGVVATSGRQYWNLTQTETISLLDIVTNYNEEGYVVLDPSSIQEENLETTFSSARFTNSVSIQLITSNFFSGDSFQLGYDNGFTQGEESGFTQGFQQGEEQGYNKGLEDGTNSIYSFNWIRSAVSATTEIFQIELIPNIQLGYLIGIPLIFSILAFVLRWFR